MSEHTPGPWETDKTHKTRVYAKDRPGFRGFYRVGDAYFSSAGLANTPSHKEAVENAKMFAAAPDLLKALEEAKPAVEQLCVGQIAENECWNVLKRIEAAIAKAKGGAA